jgi:hypothetical protein
MMGPSEKMQVTGRLTIVLKGPDGSVKDVRDIKNLVVNAGLAHITSRLLGTSSGVMSHMALGSGTTAAAAGNTALGSQLGSRKTLTSSVQSGTNNEAITYVATFAAGEGTGAVTEAGIFNAATAGTMLCRTVFSVVNKGAADVLQVTWTVAFSG